MILALLKEGVFMTHLKYSAVFGIGLIASSMAFAKMHDNELKVIGSLQVSGIPQAGYPKLAKISAADATRIALTQVPGNVLSVGLENEDGFLIYAVEVIGNPSKRHEILIDAGNGKVLSSTSKNEQSTDEDDEQDDD